MYALYALVFPFAALMLALLAAYFFPFPLPEFLTPKDKRLFFMYQFVDYLLSLFMLFFCILLLRRTVKRSFSFLLQLPVPLTKWVRWRHLVPIALSSAVVVYLLHEMFFHTFIGVGVTIWFEWFSRKSVRLLHDKSVQKK